jgi:hypothetical protein
MPTRKSVKSKIADSLPAANHPRRSRKGAKSSSPVATHPATFKGSRRGVDLSRLIAPAAAAVASGALAATGYAFREKLGDALVDALAFAAKKGANVSVAAGKAAEETADHARAAATKASEATSIDALLRYAGLEKANPARSIVGPAVGAALGLAVGAALTFFWAPKLLSQFKRDDATNSDVPDTHEPPTSGEASPEDTRSSSKLHHGIS